jgi:hypothetical protein
VRCIRIFTIFLTILILTSAFIPSISAKVTAESDQPRIRFIDWIAELIFDLGVNFFGIPWNVLRFVEPDPFVPDKEYLEIGFYDTASVFIGVIDETTGNYKSLKDFSFHPLFPSSEFEFTIEYPDYLPEDYFIAKFDPQILHLYKDGEAKVELTIISKVPDDVALPENIVLRVNITKYVSAQNTYLPPKDNRGIMPFNFITGKASTFLWLLASIGFFGGFAFGPYYSGKRVADYSTYVDIIVKLRRTHLVDIVTPAEIVELSPDSVYSIPVKIENFGSHIDTFNFRVFLSATESNLTISPPPAITLGPNEEAIVKLGIATSDELWDPGTLHSVKVEAYSIYEPDLVFNNTVSLVTKGLYVSEINLASIVFSGMVLIILIVVIFFIFKHRKRKKKIKRKTKKKIEIKKIKEFLSRLRPEEKVEKKAEEKSVPIKKEELVEKEVVIEESYLKPKFDIEAERDQRRKQRTLVKIRKVQEKQKRKM